MKKIYISPKVEVHRFAFEDVITTSGVSTLTDGGNNGKAQSGSYTDLFGKD